MDITNFLETSAVIQPSEADDSVTINNNFKFEWKDTNNNNNRNTMRMMNNNNDDIIPRDLEDIYKSDLEEDLYYSNNNNKNNNNNNELSSDTDEDEATKNRKKNKKINKNNKKNNKNNNNDNEDNEDNEEKKQQQQQNRENPFDKEKRDYEKHPFLTTAMDKINYYRRIRYHKLMRRKEKLLHKGNNNNNNNDDDSIPSSSFLGKNEAWYQYINENRPNPIDFKGSALSNESPNSDEPPRKKRRIDIQTPAAKEKDMASQQIKKKEEGSEIDFISLRISRVILKAIRDLGWQSPTPVQANSIPPALAGKDLFINAVTGSGKTAAFMIPVLERLLFTTDRTAASRVLVVTPTRELAAQCLEMTNQLSKYSPVTLSLVVGGLDAEAQEVALRRKPDIIICTPGRMIDLVRNSRGVSLEDVEILVLDEADRLLDMGFLADIQELVSHTPKERQTILLSATLTEDVLNLAELSLNNPEKIAVDPSLCLAQNLTQEFVRVPQGFEKRRYAMLLALCLKNFTKSVIIFCRTKKETHLLRLMFGLIGLKAAELHGNMSQLDRLDALKAFREQQVDYLLCTDVAARGIDIQGVQTVINIEFPTNIKTYIHRVGRTARAGCQGHAVTLVGEQRKKLLKTLIASSSSAANGMKSRIINPDFVQWCNDQIIDMKFYCKRIISEEQREREMRLSNILINKSQNMVKHGQEIFHKPKKEWYISAQEKKRLKKDAYLNDLGEDYAAEMKEKINKKIEETMRRKKLMESGMSLKEIKEQEKKQLEQMSKFEKERYLKKQETKYENQQRRKEMQLSQKLAKQALSEQRKARISTKLDKQRESEKLTGHKRNRKYMEEMNSSDRLARESSREMRRLEKMGKAKQQNIKRNVAKRSKKKKYAHRR